jgi:predicted hotdog family 3-hydroxylacyl-ACP dehydratase
VLGKADIAGMIPHAGRMCLLEQVAAWDETTIRCLARSHRDPANPMRAGAELPALCGIEYAAQAMAVHGRLSSAVAARPRVGYLASVSDVLCNTRRLDDVAGDLIIEAERLAGDEARVLYAFRVFSKNDVLLSGKAAVVLDAA